MQIRRLFFLLFIFIALPLTANVKQVLAVADSLYGIGEHNLALIEYRRYLCFEAPELVHSLSYQRLALCYRDLSEADLALKYIESAIYSSENDSLRANYTIDKAIILMTKQNYGLADFVLRRLILVHKNPEISQRARLALALNYVLQANWIEAKNSLQSYASEMNRTDDTDLINIYQLLDELSQVKAKDAKKAKKLSTWIPGAGQLYSGDYRNAANSFVINAGITYWLVDATMHRHLLDLYPIAFLLWKYYQGSRYHAERICLQHNAEEKQRHIKAAAESMAPLWKKGQ